MLLVFLLILGYECPDCFKLAKTFYWKLLFRKKSRVQGEITRPAYLPSDDYSKHLPLASQNAKSGQNINTFREFLLVGVPNSPSRLFILTGYETYADFRTRVSLIAHVLYAKIALYHDHVNTITITWTKF